VQMIVPRSVANAASNMRLQEIAVGLALLPEYRCWSRGSGNVTHPFWWQSCQWQSLASERYLDWTFVLPGCFLHSYGSRNQISTLLETWIGKRSEGPVAVLPKLSHQSLLLPLGLGIIHRLFEHSFSCCVRLTGHLKQPGSCEFRDAWQE
jgi:hypothetical protein